jgi:putative membrane protein
MKTGKRILAGILATAVLAPSLAVPVQAARAPVTTDESMYVNLDHYGKVEQINVVKRVGLNGNSEFTDYGSYQKVTNMSNLAKPNVSAQGVGWKLPESTGSFYYECTLKPEAASLPWSFDVSYQLNGVPTNADKLAGASGTVEVTIKAIPNKNVSDYYKNNMLLQVGTMVDMEDTLSVEAPGAQVQTVGKSKLVLFAALPGEETTFTMRIGTKKFETDGLVIMMVPGTLEQMKDIKEIKDDKDTVKDSADAISDSTNLILGTIESTSAGLRRVQSGLSSVDRARGTISSAKDGLYDKADLSLADLTAVAQQTAVLVPHLQSAQQMVGDVNGDLNALTKTVEEAKPYLNSLDGSIGEIQGDIKKLREVLDDVGDASGDRDEVLREMKKDIKSARGDLSDLQPLLSSLNKSLTELSTLLGQLQEVLAGSSDPQAPAQITLLEKTKAVLDSTNSLVAALGAVCDQADEYLDTAEDTADLAEVYFDALDDGVDAADSTLKHSNELGSSTQSLLRQGEALIDRASALNGTMNRYEPETVSALKDTEELTRRLTSALNSSNAFLSSFESTMKASDGNLDAGTRDSLNGMIDVLGKSLDGISQTSVIKKANNTIKDTIDKETDKYEDDNNLLNLDAEAKPVSFTSAKNPSPESIQIILRTEEISLDDEEDNTKDLEKEKEKISPFQRMLNVFQKIWQSVIDAFQE